MSSYFSFFPESGKTSAADKKIFMPFMDITLGKAYTLETLKTVYEQSGLTHFTLAFANMGQYGTDPDAICWAQQDNHPPYVIETGKKNWYQDEIDFIRSKGGDVMISLGGMNGIPFEPAVRFTDVNKIVEIYQRVVDAYNLKYFDWDVEGGEVKDHEANHRRAKALKILTDNNPGLKISMTLPVNTDGLTDDGIKLVQFLVDEGVNLWMINGMSMEFHWYHIKDQPMSVTILASCRGLEKQADAAGWPSSLLFGTTPMIGQSYARPEVVYPEDYKRIIDYMKSNPRHYMLGFWSIGRDNGTCGKSDTASYGCSGLDIEYLHFTKTCLKELDGLIDDTPIDDPPGGDPPEKCPDGYTRNPATGLCEKDKVDEPTPPKTPPTTPPTTPVPPPTDGYWIPYIDYYLVFALSVVISQLY